METRKLPPEGVVAEWRPKTNLEEDLKRCLHSILDESGDEAMTQEADLLLKKYADFGETGIGVVRRWNNNLRKGANS